MEKQAFDTAYLILGTESQKTPLIRTGNFYYKPYQHHYLTDVTLEKVDDGIKIHGHERTFVRHEPHEPMFGVDITRNPEKYEIKESDWYQPKPGRLDRLFGKKPKKALEEKLYMMKAAEEKTFVIEGGFIHEHTD